MCIRDRDIRCPVKRDPLEISAEIEGYCPVAAAHAQTLKLQVGNAGMRRSPSAEQLGIGQAGLEFILSLIHI